MTALDAICIRAARHTGRALRWQIADGKYRLYDDTHTGNLVLEAGTDGGLREVYMRIRHFGLTPEDCTCIKQALRAVATNQLQIGAEDTTP